MKLLCTFGGHEAGEIESYSGGYHFSQCRHCGTAMIRLGGAWQNVPDNHAVVWRSGIRIEEKASPATASPIAEVSSRAAESGTLRTNAAAAASAPGPASRPAGALPALAHLFGSGLGRLLGTHIPPEPAQRLNRG